MVKKGEFTIYFGPMTSGKTERLLLAAKDVESLGGKPVFFKPNLDLRDKVVRSRGLSKTYNPLFVYHDMPDEIIILLDVSDKFVFLDEIQFFNKGIVETINRLLNKGKTVFASGLDLDFRREPFGSMEEIIQLAEPENRYHLRSTCSVCRADAEYTQLLVNEEPAPYNYMNESVIIEGRNASERYEPRCLKHHEIEIPDFKR